MSATLRVSEFTENKHLFRNKKVPVIDIESRQFPVQIHYNRNTPENYIDEAVKKCSKIHTSLPPGHILVFLTGEREIKEFCYKLRASLEAKRNQLKWSDEEDDEDEQDIPNNEKIDKP